MPKLSECAMNFFIALIFFVKQYLPWVLQDARLGFTKPISMFFTEMKGALP